MNRKIVNLFRESLHILRNMMTDVVRLIRGFVATPLPFV
jgi:hypothetical protein